MGIVIHLILTLDVHLGVRIAMLEECRYPFLEKKIGEPG